MIPKLVISDLNKSFGPKTVLKSVNLTLNPKESLVVIGGSGMGKSVMLKCILGLLRPSSGSIKLDGVELVGAKPKLMEEQLKKIGMLFQGSALFDSLPIWENITFRLLQEKRITRKAAKDLAVEKLSAVGMESSVAALSPSEISGGMQRRVALARAIACEPEVLLFDEPTAGLDPVVANVINDLIVKCVKDLGATAITITHDMNSARRIANQIAMLHKGQIQWHGPIEKLDQTNNPYVDQFIHGRSHGPITQEVKVNG